MVEPLPDYIQLVEQATCTIALEPDDVRYIISRWPGPGSGGVLVVMTGLAGTGRLAAGYAAAAGTVLVLLACAALALPRAILRPLRKAAEFAESAGQAAGSDV